MTTETVREGMVSVPGGNVWYRIIGSGPGIPLLLLHGGPGAGHDYLEPLAALCDERPVVFYDQLGCGRSDIPDDDSLWEIDRFVRELDAVRESLGLDRVHLYGQSWGGFLAIEYLVGHPQGVVSAVLANTASSSEGFAREARRLVAGLPEETRAAIERCEASGDFEAPEYQTATFEFYRQHVCRVFPWPEPAVRTMANLAISPTYAHMWGPSEFTMTGTLAGWNRSADLGKIDVPALIVCGEYDEAAPPLAKELHSGIPGSELAIVEDASHLTHIEQPDVLFPLLRDFMHRAEAT